MSFREHFRVNPGNKVRVEQMDASAVLGLSVKEPDPTLLEAARHQDMETMAGLQHKLFAENKRALLVILQGIDCAGKDGVVRHCFTGFNPTGCKVWSFKAPTLDEQGHDFLWRIHQRTPGKGEVVVFNRSHYEDVLIARVKELVPEDVWRPRYDTINAFERYLTSGHTEVLKLFLLIDKDQQRRRLQKRVDNPEKNWKFDPADISERERWDDYIKAFDEMLEKCSTEWAPWHIIPANRKWYRNYAVTRILRETLEEMNPKFPAPRDDISGMVIK